MVKNVERYGEHWRWLAGEVGRGCSKRNLGFSSPVYLKGSAIVSIGAGTTRRGLMTFIGNGGVGTHQGYPVRAGTFRRRMALCADLENRDVLRFGT